MKRYIGDGVYVDFDGYQLLLTTENGYRETNRIALYPSIYGQLVRYVDDLRANQSEPKDSAK